MTHPILAELNPDPDLDHWFAHAVADVTRHLNVARARIDETLKALADEDGAVMTPWNAVFTLADHAGYSGTVQAAIADAVAKAGIAVGMAQAARIAYAKAAEEVE